MVTHDVDEALFLSDRIVCMTDGPEAEVGDILEVHFSRPRERKAVMEHPDYYGLREHLIEFLEVHAHKNQRTTPSEPHGGDTPSPPSERGEGRGEEGRPGAELPLTPALSPLLRRGERENAGTSTDVTYSSQSNHETLDSDQSNAIQKPETATV